MFYCDKCREKKSWPKTLFGSLGICEICGEVSRCNDMPSSRLPLPKEVDDGNHLEYNKRVELEYFIKKYVPKGWIGPIHQFDFAPLISEQDYKTIMSGSIPENRQYQKWYIKAAIQAWKDQEFKQNSK